MVHYFLRHVLLTLLLAGGTLLAGAQEIATSPLDNRQSMLSGRAFATFPPAAVSSARPPGLMAAAPDASQETRIVLDFQQRRLVFLAQELYALGDKKTVMQFVGEQDGRAGATTTVVAENGSVFAVQSTPTAFDSTREAILVNSLLVRTTDNTIFRLAAYINPAAYDKRAEFVQLTTRVFATLTAGPRLSSRAAHLETLDLRNTGRKLRIAVPANYALTTSQQPDFQAFVLHHYRPLGDEQRDNLTIYAGHHPTYFFRSFRFERDEAQLVKGTFLGKPIHWLHFTNADKQVYIKEQQVPSDNLAAGLILHVGMLGSTEPILEELTKIAGAITLVK